MNKFFKFIKTDFFIIFFLLIISSIPRLALLDKIPLGIHGDEGWNGIIAREILSKGSVPAYIDAATGIPSGSIYLTAIIFKFFGDNIFFLRLSSAVTGILTVIALYMFFRLFFNKKVSLLTTVAFNFSLIHLHYSRIAFNVIYVSLLQLMSLVFIILARRNNNSILIVLGAIFAGLGLHIYHVFILFPFSLIILLLIDIYRHKFSYQKIKQLLLFIIFFVIVSFPILKVMVFQPDFYFSHVKTYNVLNKDNIKNKSNFIGKSKLILKNGFENLSFFVWGGRIDFVDAFGNNYNFNKSYIALFLLGIILTFFKKSRFDFFIFLSLIFFLTPTFFTFEGTYRRSILTLIYFYYFIAVALNWTLNIAKNKYHIILIFLFTFIILFESSINLSVYFNRFPRDEETKSVFFAELTKAALLINNNSFSSSKIYLFSDRNPCSHETIRYLLINYKCEDRSTEYGSFSIENIGKSSVILLINKYTPLITEIKTRYKNGQEYLIKDHESDKILGIIYKI